MKKLRLILILAGLAFCLFIFAACEAKPKVFESGGIKITATTDFVKKDIIGQTIYLESKDKIITGLKEEPNITFPVTKTLREYTLLVLETNLLTSISISAYEQDGIVFDYFEYQKSISGKDYTYFAITKKSDSYFYLFNFACETKNFSNFYEQFFNWAKLIEIE